MQLMRALVRALLLTRLSSIESRVPRVSDGRLGLSVGNAISHANSSEKEQAAKAAGGVSGVSDLSCKKR